MKKMLLLFLGFAFSFSSGASDLSDYSGPWQTRFHPGITKALVAKQIRGCGEMKYKESSKHRNEFLVYCSRDGSNWMAYLVWPNIKAVEGPFQAGPFLE